MKKLIALILLALVVFLVLNRNRVYLRDPIAKVLRDGMPVDGAKVLINYPNDILLDDSSAGRHRVYLVQHWNKIVGTPAAPLRCVQGVACMADADQATVAPVPPGSRGRRSPFEGVTMTEKQVEFVDEDGALVNVLLH